MAPSDFTSDSPPAALPQEPAADTVQAYRRRFASARVVIALVLREMSSRYGRTPGGFIWALLEPLGMIGILSIGFSLLMRNPPLGNSFILFYASGFLPFNTSRNVESAVTEALRYSRPLLFFPAVTWLDALVARFVLNVITQFFFAAVLLSAIAYFSGTTGRMDIVTIVEGMLLAAFLGFSTGSLLGFLTGMSGLFATVWKIISRPMFLASAVLYLYEDVPGFAQDILWWNPLVHVVGFTRSGIFTSYQPHDLSLAYVIGFALVCLFFGVLFTRAYHQDIINNY